MASLCPTTCATDFAPESDNYGETLRSLPPQFTSVWINDHFQFGDAPLLEAWTAMSYLAAEFPRYKVGSFVLGQNYRNPALLAKMAATLQYLSGGRLILGLGAGWHEEEYRAYNYDFPSPGERVAQLAETIEICHAMWTQSPATYHGEHYRIDNAYCEPHPDPMIPIIVGTNGKKALKIVARLADAWTSGGSFEGWLVPTYEQLRRNCDEVGRDVKEITIWPECFFDLPDDPANASEPDPDEFAFGPTPADAIRQLQQFVDFGISHFIINAQGRNLERFCEEVLPSLA